MGKSHAEWRRSSEVCVNEAGTPELSSSRALQRGHRVCLSTAPGGREPSYLPTHSCLLDGVAPSI